ncbi:hypothetical protein HanRHA438_Chr08g0360461 [Helianthus annuus]|nr:hypothetical protein HanRHA438_Chr08g0360461 [Helianthus annuus]
MNIQKSNKAGAYKWGGLDLVGDWNLHLQNNKPLGSSQRWEGPSATTLDVRISTARERK